MDLYGLDIAQTARLKRALELIEGQAGPVLARQPRNYLPAANILVGILESPVAATTSLIGPPKMGLLNVYSFSSTGVLDTGVDEPVFGFAPQIWTTDRWTVAERCSLTGRLMLTTQYCS